MNEIMAWKCEKSSKNGKKGSKIWKIDTRTPHIGEKSKNWAEKSLKNKQVCSLFTRMNEIMAWKCEKRAQKYEKLTPGPPTIVKDRKIWLTILKEQFESTSTDPIHKNEWNYGMKTQKKGSKVWKIDTQTPHISKKSKNWAEKSLKKNSIDQHPPSPTECTK